MFRFKQCFKIKEPFQRDCFYLTIREFYPQTGMPSSSYSLLSHVYYLFDGTP